MSFALVSIQVTIKRSRFTATYMIALSAGEPLKSEMLTNEEDGKKERGREKNREK